MDCDLFVLIFIGVVIGGTTVIGMIGNTISFAVLSRMQQSPTIILLRSLCWSDNIYLLLSFMIRGLPNYSYWFQCNAAAFVNRWLWPIGVVGLNCTAWLTVTITIYRYIAVTKPLHARMITTSKRTYILLAFIVGFSSLLITPRFFELRIDRDKNASCWRDTYTEMYKNLAYKIAYKFLLNSMLYFFLPPIVCLIFTIRLVIVLRHTLKKRKAYVSSRREMNITKMSVIVVLIYLITQLPSVILVIVRFFKDINYDKRCTAYYIYLNFSEFLLVINSSVNFFIYYCSTQSFRMCLVGLFKSICNKFRCYCKINTEVFQKETGYDDSFPSSVMDSTNHTYL